MSGLKPPTVIKKTISLTAPPRIKQKSQKTNLPSAASLNPVAHISFPVLSDLREPGASTAILDGLNGTRTALEARSHKHLRSELAICYHVALLLQQDAKAWKAFCDDEWLNEARPPKVSRPEQALQYSLKRYVGSGKGASKKVSYYKKCLGSSFASRMPAEELYGLIEDGVGKLVEVKATKHRRVKKQAADFKMSIEIGSRPELFSTVVNAEWCQRLLLSAGPGTKARYFIVAMPYSGSVKGGQVIKDALSLFLDDPRKVAGLKPKARN